VQNGTLMAQPFDLEQRELRADPSATPAMHANSSFGMC
jgi:hypothetical protein